MSIPFFMSLQGAEPDVAKLQRIAMVLQNQWEFVARVYNDEEVSSEYVLNINKKRYLPEGQGFPYHENHERHANYSKETISRGRGRLHNGDGNAKGTVGQFIIGYRDLRF